ncbi:hypothetical protein HMPREF9004_0079 [Schaalia cardiffensis F0333]|uniref:Uncharacterized protein n=1 Tax=Schaalia cardiffensis F0333 TaxID=888050 RepID=N6W9C7_9ACTO|nr:hypothetical protein HMPREF9004_0079 [Schaalia cardiffensis F0333]
MRTMDSPGSDLSVKKGDRQLVECSLGCIADVWAQARSPAKERADCEVSF